MHHILVIDDETDNLTMFRYVLEAHHFMVDTADNVKDAIAIAFESTPDLFLVDLHIPGIDGFDAILYIRTQPNLQHCPIVVVTSDDSAEAYEKAYAAGCNGFLVKPVQPPDLIESLQKLL